MDTTFDFSKKALDWLFDFGPKIAVAALILFVGLWLIKKLTTTFTSVLKARNVDESLRPFFVSVVEVGMKVALLLVVAGRLGFETTSFIAVLSALAFAIGLALQGSLGNFASGVLILLFRPYRVGDLITVNGLTGDVKEIQIFNTILQTPSGKKIIIPNGTITSGAIENIARDAEIRAEFKVVFVDSTSLALVKAVSSEVIRRHPNVLETHEPYVSIVGFPGGGVEMLIGAWTTGEHHDSVIEYMHDELKKAFDSTGIQLAKDDKKMTFSGK